MSNPIPSSGEKATRHPRAEGGFDASSATHSNRQPTSSQVADKLDGGTPPLPSSAYSLFKRGYDTFEIAGMLKCSEAEALREINQFRSALIQKPYPYGTHMQPAVNAITRGSRPSRNRWRKKVAYQGASHRRGQSEWGGK